MTEIPGGDPSICDTCNEPIVGPVFRVGVERFCKKHYQEQTVMAGRKLTIEDFPLKTEGPAQCWILGCDARHYARGLCKKHYNASSAAGVRAALVAQIDARSKPKGPPSKYTSPQAEVMELNIQILEVQGQLQEVDRRLSNEVLTPEDRLNYLDALQQSAQLYQGLVAALQEAVGEYPAPADFAKKSGVGG